MDNKSKTARISLLLLAALVLSAPLAAQVPVDENGQPIPALEDEAYADFETGKSAALSSAELEELVGPVALYPDDLLAIVLPASTYPLEIVQAARFLDELAKDSSLEPDESWDESVVALLNYPEVVYMMDKEIDWTWRLGEAVITQQAEVLAAVEAFRGRAYAAGNLESDERQTVSRENGVIEIEPVDEEIIYVPYYEPEEVIVYQPRRVYHYYPYAYPVYYYPYPVGYSFASGYFWGVTTAFTIGWHHHYLHVHHPSYWGHPYYGHHYYGHYYRRPSISVFNYWYVNSSYRTSAHRYRDGDYWRPRHHRSGARPATQTVRNHHYPAGDSDRIGSRSAERTRGQLRQESRGTIRTDNGARLREAGTADRSRANASGNRLRTTVVSNDNDNGTPDRQRNRAERRRPANDATAREPRQRLLARDPQQPNSHVPARQAREPVQRNAPRPAATVTRSAHPPVQQSPPVARQNASAAVQRQAPRALEAARPAAQRQAGSHAAARERHAERSSAPANRGQGRNHARREH